MNVFELTKKLMSIPSVSGEEEAVGLFLRDHLESLGWKVELQPVEAPGAATLLSPTPLAVSDVSDDETSSVRTGVSSLQNDNLDGAATLLSPKPLAVSDVSDDETSPVRTGVSSLRQYNVIATLNDTPRVWLSTHMDTVPPFIPPTEDDEKIYGRGACDAKGIIAAQIIAAEQLSKEGITNIGLLYTVEEERASTGAKAANLHPLAAKCEYLINGEPTDNDLAVGSKGSFRFKIKTRGKAAHSAYPEEGDSAIETLLDILREIRETVFPQDEFFGETTVNIGTIEGGLALNIIPPHAEAGFLVRLVTERGPVEKMLENIVRGRGEIEVLSCSEPVKMVAVEGFPQKVVRFTTDIPHLPNWKNPLLLGPGSILVAHTKDEFVMKKDLETAVEQYFSLVKNLLTT